MNKKLILVALMFSTVLGTALPHSLVAAEQQPVQAIKRKLLAIAGGLATGAATAYVDYKWTVPMLLAGMFKTNRYGNFDRNNNKQLMGSLTSLLSSHLAMNQLYKFIGKSTSSETTARVSNWLGWGVCHLCMTPEIPGMLMISSVGLLFYAQNGTFSTR